MTMSDGTVLVGLFATPADAESENADELALGSIAASSLTPEQLEVANSNGN